MSTRALRPNPSLKRSDDGMARWPSSAGPAAHFALAVQRDMPLALRLSEGLGLSARLLIGAALLEALFGVRPR